ncbi:hypothetical protein B0H14DRAFT_2634789 [Mycena olivaceomarginata]|nr:hypothetical protein B0H14DRAFT_2634789 [Mycena olivaceomarginata]
MRPILVTLDIPHEPSDPVRVLREEIRAHILILRKRKHVECEQQEKYEKFTRFNEELRQIRENWPQLVPQEGEDVQMPSTYSGGLHSYLILMRALTYNTLQLSPHTKLVTYLSSAKSRTRNLIAPHDLYGKLTKGTLSSAQVSLSTYINKEHVMALQAYAMAVVSWHSIALMDLNDQRMIAKQLKIKPGKRGVDSTHWPLGSCICAGTISLDVFSGVPRGPITRHPANPDFKHAGRRKTVPVSRRQQPSAPFVLTDAQDQRHGHEPTVMALAPVWTPRQVSHVNVQKATILDKGDGGPWNPPSPDLPSAVPSTPSKRARDPAVENAFDDLSSSKKARTA